MNASLVAFGGAFAIAVAATPPVRAVARRVGALDRPDRYRKIHEHETPLLGGLAIYLAFVAPVVAIRYLPWGAAGQIEFEQWGEVMALIAGAAVALGQGVADDLRGLPARWKLLLQAAAATVAFAGGLSIRAISNPFGHPLALGLWSYPVTLFWFLGCMNAVNLLDGLDGLATGVCLFATITLFLVSLFFGNVLGAVLMACLCGAALGFLLYNFHPASIFLGDSGSILLGYLVAGLSLLGAARKAEAAVALLIPIVALGLPIFDTMLAIGRRWYRKLPVSAADREHVHHALLRLGLSHRRTVLLLYAVCLMLCGGAVLLTAGRNDVTLMVLGSVGIIAFVSIRLFGQLRLREVLERFSDDWTRGRHCASARLAVEKAVDRMRAADTVGAVWEAFAEASGGLELDFARLCPNGDHGFEGAPMVWESAREQENGGRDVCPDGWFAVLSVHSNGRLFGELQLGRRRENGQMLSVTPELVERLRQELGAHLDRLSGRRASPSQS
jgi:UDP-GlcNAc:undecaprenyl-phosphate GlcNAc-1-phosphate transferase